MAGRYGFDKAVILNPAAGFEAKRIGGPEAFVIKVRNGAARAVAGKPGDAAVGIDDLSEIIGLADSTLFENGYAIGTRAGISVTDRNGKVRERNGITDFVALDHDIIVTKTVKFAE